jgi:hypothetical protein
MRDNARGFKHGDIEALYGAVQQAPCPARFLTQCSPALLPNVLLLG